MLVLAFMCVRVGMYVGDSLDCARRVCEFMLHKPGVQGVVGVNHNATCILREEHEKGRDTRVRIKTKKERSK